MDEHRRVELQQFVNDLSEVELRLLYEQLGERYRMQRKAEEMRAMSQFRVTDRVFFHHNGEHIRGIVIRVNQRTLSVLTDLGRRWTVAPEYLTHETTSPPPPSSAPADRVFVQNTAQDTTQNTAQGRSNPRGKSHKNQKRKKRKR